MSDKGNVCHNGGGGGQYTPENDKTRVLSSLLATPRLDTH